MPNLDDICWATITFREKFLIDDMVYLAVLRNNAFLEKLRNHPQDLDADEVRSLLVWFLNKWGCRLRNDNITASNLKNCIVDAHPELLAVQNHSILNFDFELPMNMERIENIFKRFWDYRSQITNNFGPTATSKTLHIINPDLFTMWDDEIKAHHGFPIGSGNEYVQFLIQAKGIAEGLVNECIERYGIEDPALWLSQNLNLNPSLSLVKFIDEFNWLAYTGNLLRPPDWVCPF